MRLANCAFVFLFFASVLFTLNQISYAGQLKGTSSHLAALNTLDASKLPLDDVEDAALTLQAIRQSAVGIYLECTRQTDAELKLRLDSIALTSVPTAPLASAKSYLPLRKAWLVYFVGSMEPLVTLLTNDLKDLENGSKKLSVPENKKEAVEAVVKEWKLALGSLEKHLGRCAEYIDSDGEVNLEVARCAQSIDADVATMKGLLKKACEIVEPGILSSK